MAVEVRCRQCGLLWGVENWEMHLKTRGSGLEAIMERSDVQMMLWCCGAVVQECHVQISRKAIIFGDDRRPLANQTRSLGIFCLQRTSSSSCYGHLMFSSHLSFFNPQMSSDVFSCLRMSSDILFCFLITVSIVA